MERSELPKSPYPLDILVLMGEGDTGAAVVLGQMLKKEPTRAISLIVSLDDMNIRGKQIWQAFREYYDINKFMDAIENNDERVKMVTSLNSQALEYGEELWLHKAVVSSASISGRECFTIEECEAHKSEALVS